MMRIPATLLIATLCIGLVPSVTSAKKKTDDTCILLEDLEERRAFLNEVDPIDVVEIPLEQTLLDNELRAFCEATEALPTGEWWKDIATLQKLGSEQKTVHRLSVLADRVGEVSADESITVGKGDEAVSLFLYELDQLKRACEHVSSLDRLEDTDLAHLQTLVGEGEIKSSAAVVDGLTPSANAMTAALKEVKAAGDDEPMRGEALRKAAELIRPAQAGESAGLPSPRLVGGRGQAIAEGLADFLIDRAKEEALNYLRETFVKQLCEGPVQPFVRETCKAFEAVEHTVALRAIGSSLRAAVTKDLQRLPDVGLMLAASYDGNLGYAAAGTRIVISAFRSARNGQDPLGFARSLHAASLVDCEKTEEELAGVKQCRDALALLRSASALLYALEQQSGSKRDRYWLMATLLSWELRDSEIPKGVDKYRPRKLSAAAVSRLADPVGKVWRSVELTSQLIRQIRDDAADGRIELRGSRDLLAAAVSTIRAAMDAARAIRCAVEPGECGGSVASAAGDGSPASSESRDPAGRDGQPEEATPNGMVVALVQAEPSGSPDALARFLSGDSLAQLQTLAAAISSEDWASAVPAALQYLEPQVRKRIGEDNWTELGKFLPVMVEIASAQSSADVAATLEAAVPAGGYKSKYRDRMLAINGFLGFYGGGERYVADGDPTYASNLAMFAPIGLHLAGPVGKAKKRWGMGGLLSVIDLGALTTRKLTEEEITVPDPDDAEKEVEVDDIPPLDLRELFSPGLYFTVGIAESPATFGIGVSYNPFLREQTVTTTPVDDQGMPTGDPMTEISKIPAWRVGLFVAVDITFFAFRVKRL